MSNIEKALEKYKDEIRRNSVKASLDKGTDTLQAGENEKDKPDPHAMHRMTEDEKGDFVSDGLDIPGHRSSCKSGPAEEGNYIVSAIEKKKNGKNTVQDPWPDGEDENQSGFEIQNITGAGHDDAEVIPAIRMTDYDVDEHIVSYYDSIGRQTWKGPVMVHFRRIQVSLNNMHENRGCKVMLFTSASQKEGKSTIALNTAITLCTDKKSKVVVVDCDFRKPTINKLLGFSPDKGLSDYLSGGSEIKDIFINGLISGLTVIPAGNKPPNTCELFASDRMKQFLLFLRERFDYVVIDTPPVLAFPDTVILSPLSDGVVFVVNCKNARKAVVKRAVDTLHDSRIVGFVMNMGETAAVDYYGYTSDRYYYDYASS